MSQIGPKAVGTSAPLVLLHCHLAVHSGSDRDALLMDRLPSSRRVTSITAHRRLRLFKGGPTTWDGPPSALSREQMDALAPSYPPPSRPGGAGGTHGSRPRPVRRTEPRRPRAARRAGRRGPLPRVDGAPPHRASAHGRSTLLRAGRGRASPLYGYLSDRIGALPGVDMVKTAPIIRTLGRDGAVARNHGPGTGERR
ncbi:hypothetical protein [Streptomyces atratus]|uniref:hypothetical protein n=1 Tax=Streptomyces atratus TaxID=1893 RepID=UPI001160EE2A|nr:hypothetical protein [Streptomyces atratus]